MQFVININKVNRWGKYLMLGGVGFIHAPINPMGREYGGEK